MPRVPCFCDFAQCGGAFVDPQTFNRHKRHDSSKRFRDALTTATTACKSQDDAIAVHLASLSISDRLTDPIVVQSATVNTSSRHFGRSAEQKQVAESLYQLRDIETSLDDLITFVDGKLGNTGNPSASSVVFPLLSSISTARTIRTQLAGITSRAVSVQEAKSSLLVRSGEIVTKLEDAKRSWNKHAEDFPVQEDFTSDSIFNTGK